MESVALENVGKGKLVAFEGDSGILYTQLKLLPPSQKILILPSILESLPQIQKNEEFNARKFIRHVHQAFTERNQKAQSFLGSSTSTQPRLVFTHGGSASARSTCIARIAERVTNGKVDEAEVLFDDIIKDGVAGLVQSEESQQENLEPEKSVVEAGEQRRLEQTVEDPCTKAMKAADSLDREAAGLGEENMDNITFGGKPPKDKKESNNNDLVPPEAPSITRNHTHEDSRKLHERKSSLPVRDFISNAPQGDEIRKTVIVLPRASSILNRSTSSSNLPQLTPFSAGSYTSVPTPSSWQWGLIEDDIEMPSPGRETPVIVVGEACLVDMQQPLRTIKSMDRFLPELFAKLQPLSSPKVLRQTASFCHPQTRPMASDHETGQTSEFFQTAPRATFVKASETTIKRSTIASNYSSLFKDTFRESVDRGAFAEEATEVTEVIPFEPIFPIVEDLIINLVPRGSDEIFESVIASYKSAYLAAEKVVDSPPQNPFNAVSLQNSLREILSGFFPVTSGYSQYLYHVFPEMERLWKPVFKIDESGSVTESCRTVDQIVALGCEAGVKQEFFALISGQIERLGTKKSGTTRSGKLDIRYFIANTMQTFSDSPASPNLDPEVLASLILPQIELYLATNISTRLLILYYTSEHLGVVLALQRLVGNDILKIAGILDTLCSDPPSLARPRSPQKSCVLSSEETMARPVSRRLATLSSKPNVCNPCVPPTSLTTHKVSFSKVNYLIPNTATDTEITTFLSDIWKSLMARSSFYNPELDYSKSVSRLHPSAPRLHTAKSSTSPSSRPSTNSEKSHPRSSSLRTATSNASVAHTTGTGTGTGVASDRGSLALTKYEQSITSTVKTTASEHVRREDRAWENFYIADSDSEDDEFDKMILGREFKRIVPEGKVQKKRTTKKALKWLGLS